MSKIRRFLPILFLMTVATHVWPQQQGDISIFVRFFNKKIFYLNKTEEIKIKVTVVNGALKPVRFRVADNKVFNLDFEVKTPANTVLDHSKEFTIERSSYQYVLFKEMILEPEEEYGFIVDLNRFVDLDRSGLLTVQAFFYPILPPSGKTVPISSNILSLNLRPPLLVPELEALVEEETGEVAEREVIPPDEVVDFTILARQRSQWEKFFIYLDIERLLLKNPDWRARYNRLPEEKRLDLISDYRKELEQELVDQDILVIPTEYEILKTTYSPFEGSVIVLEKFRYRDYTEIKRYTYYLERKDRYWMITDYEVVNLGTE